MCVYTDGIHLVADCPLELHTFAKAVGLRPGWFQDHPRHPHYDLTTQRMRELAIAAGAVRVTPRRLVQVCKRVR